MSQTLGAQHTDKLNHSFALYDQILTIYHFSDLLAQPHHHLQYQTPHSKSPHQKGYNPLEPHHFFHKGQSAQPLILRNHRD